jgi:hypothetical protein
MAVPTWRDALLGYRTRRDLATRARRAPLSVQSVGSALIITPSSDHAGRAPLMEPSYNSSYIEAIVDDLRRG